MTNQQSNPGTEVVADLLRFLHASPVRFIAAREVERRLLEAGFRHVDAAEPFPQLEPGDGFFLTRNDSSVYAFRLGEEPLAEAGFRLICAHCDSPGFRVKPNPEMRGAGGLARLNTEVYGGPILSTWFDRPLGLAGRAVLRGEDALHPRSRLIDFRRPLLQISSLAIHFNRAVNDGVRLSRQKDTLPILGIASGELESGGLLDALLLEELGGDYGSLLDFDLFLYDFTPACLFGARGELVSGGRLDDLSMVHAALRALLDAGGSTPRVTQALAVFDNEETGSLTKQGAGSPFLASALRRAVARQGGGEEDFWRAVERAFMVSADNAHAFHPNYPERYDPTTRPALGGGPVVKLCAAQKYASDALTSAVFERLCERAGVPCQRFVNHSDVAGGSTLGNILSSSLPLRGVDVGAPVLAMHSARETASAFDHECCARVFRQFYTEP